MVDCILAAEVVGNKH